MKISHDVFSTNPRILRDMITPEGDGCIIIALKQAFDKCVTISNGYKFLLGVSDGYTFFRTWHTVTGGINGDETTYHFRQL
jgi:hypothetical protein